MQIAFLFWTYLVMDNPIKTQYIERTGAGGNAYAVRVRSVRKTNASCFSGRSPLSAGRKVGQGSPSLRAQSMLRLK